MEEEHFSCEYALKILRNYLSGIMSEIAIIDKYVSEGKDVYPYDYMELRQKKIELENGINKLVTQQEG